MTKLMARRLFQLVEPVALVTYMAKEPTEAVMALGLRNVWDAYFAGRAAPLGRDVPPAVVHALFYNFAEGEVARHIPRVWGAVTPEAANAAREQGSVAALRRILGDLADTPGVARAADLVTTAGTSARTEGRGIYAALRTLPAPTEPVARLWHGANLLREHRGDGHVAALLTAGIGGTEAHVLHALSEGMPAEQFGRVSHLPQAQLAAVVGGMRIRGLIGADGWLTATGRQVKERVEALTDELAAPAYEFSGRTSSTSWSKTSSHSSQSLSRPVRGRSTIWRVGTCPEPSICLHCRVFAVDGTWKTQAVSGVTACPRCGLIVARPANRLLCPAKQERRRAGSQRCRQSVPGTARRTVVREDGRVRSVSEMPRTDTASRVIAATAERAYAALVDPEALAVWLPPQGMTARFERFDASPGGSYRLALTYEGGGSGRGKATANSDVVEARFIRLVPNVRVVQRIDFESDNPTFAGTMTMTWQFSPVDRGTLVEITAEDVPDGISADDHAVGMASSLANLAKYLEG